MGSCTLKSLIGVLIFRSFSDEACPAHKDVFFLLDGSDSISTVDFLRLKSAVSETIHNLNVTEEAINVGMAVFSENIGDSVGVLPFKSKTLLTLLVKALRQPKGGTDTAMGIERATEALVQGRQGASKMMILFTDGASRDPRATVQSAKVAKRNGIHIFAVGM